MLRSLMRLVLGSRLPIVDGALNVPSLAGPLTIRRDAHGVPYIDAGCDDDAFYGMGFCHGQDRAFHIELFVRVARGTLSELTGPDMLEVDRLSRRIGFSRIAKAQFELLEPRVRAQFDAYARGVNDGVRLGLRQKPHEFVLLGAEPTAFEPHDSLAVLQFLAFALCSNWDAELARLRILREDGADALTALEAAHPTWTRALDGASRLALDVDVIEAAELLAAAGAKSGYVAGLGGASNNWVLAPSRTKTGRPLMACDPHLSPSLPLPWYLLHVRTPTWAMTGAGLPTQPMVSFGHNERVAWGVTAGHVDNTDLFIEKIGDDGRSVLEGDRFVPCELREEIIRVKGAPDVCEKVLVTRRGPIVSPALGGSAYALSMRATWMAPRRIDGYHVWRATSVEEARRSFESYPCVSENRVFADTSGHIAWQMVGDAPVRRKGHGMLPMPGWDLDGGWEDDPLPFDAMPRAIDPEIGFVASANQRPEHSPDGPFLSADWLDGGRYARIVERLGAQSDWDVASTLALQIDQTTVLWRDLRAPLLDALRAHPHVESAVALRVLDGWDGVVAARSSGAAVFELLFAEMMCRMARAKAPRSWRAVIGEGTNAVLPHGMMALRRIDHLARLLREQPSGWFARGWPAEISDALVTVARKLRSVAGESTERWAWGRVRPLTLVHPVGEKPPMGRVFNLGPIEFGGDVTTIPQASVDFADPLGNAIGVPNMRTVIDVGRWEESRWVLAGGQSGNPMSPHYGDMLGHWLRGEGIAIAWEPETVRREARSTLRLNQPMRSS